VSKKKSFKEPLEIVNPQDRLNILLKMQRQNDIISMILDGKDNKEIIKYLVNRYNVTIGSANVFISDAQGAIKKRQSYEINNLIMIHIARYEAIYKGLVALNAQGAAIRCLQQKERLLGFHKEGFHMRINQGEISAFKLTTVDSEYNTKKLPEEKQKRLEELLEKMKREGGRKAII
jgi:hypothetical protein